MRPTTQFWIDNSEEIVPILNCSGVGGDVVIQFTPREKTRIEEAIAQLRMSAGVSAPMDPAIVIKRKAAEVATAMAQLHGGDWQVQIDHQEGFVLVVPRL